MVPDSSGPAQPTADARAVRPYTAVDYALRRPEPSWTMKEPKRTIFHLVKLDSISNHPTHSVGTHGQCNAVQIRAYHRIA